MTPDKSEQAKEKLFEKLRKGNLDGIELILDEINKVSISIPLILVSRGVTPEIADQYYTKLRGYYQKKGKRFEGLANAVTIFQKKHRQEYFGELK